MATSTLANAPGRGRKVVKGAYLEAIQNYVSTLDFNDRFPFTHGVEFDRLTSELCKFHSEYLNELDAQGIIYRECVMYGAELGHRADRPDDLTDVKLKEELVARFKNSIESIPKEYTFRIELPSLQNYGIATHRISEHVSLVTGSHRFERSSNTNSETLTLANMLRTPVTSSYLEFKIYGYATPSLESSGLSESISMAKQVAFVLNTSDLIEEDWRGEKSRSTIANDSDREELKVDLPNSLSSCFGKMSINETDLMVYHDHQTIGGLLAATSLLTAAPTLATSSQEKQDALNSRLDVIGRFFQYSDHADFHSISAAMEWYQDSIYADNQTFSYLAACIGMEALIGSENTIDEMSKRLGDRYAFLIGKGRSERERLITQYGEVLKLRGKLVHAKASKLSLSDRKLLRIVQNMLRQAISHEMNEMYRN